MPFEIQIKGQTFSFPNQEAAMAAMQEYDQAAISPPAPIGKLESALKTTSDTLTKVADTVSGLNPIRQGFNAMFPALSSPQAIKESFQAVPSKAEGGTDLNRLSAGLVGLADTASFGTRPYITAAAEAPFSDQSFKELLSKYQGTSQEAQKFYPTAYNVGGIGGFLKGVGPKIYEALAGASPGLLRRIGAGVASNIGYGQLSEPVDSENRGGRALTDALAALVPELSLTGLEKLRQFNTVNKALKTKTLADIGQKPSVEIGNLRPDVYPEVAEPQAIIEQKTGVRIPATASESTKGSAALDSTQGFLDQSLFSQSQMRAKGLAQDDAVTQVAQQVEEAQGLPRQTLSGTSGLKFEKPAPRVDEHTATSHIANAYEKISQDLSGKHKQMFDEINGRLAESSSNMFVPETTRSVGMQQIQNMSAGGKGITTPSVERILKNANAFQSEKIPVTIPDALGGERVVRQNGKIAYREVPKSVSLQDLNQLRKDIDDLAWVKKTPQEVRMLTDLKKAIDQDYLSLSQKAAQSGNAKLAQDILKANDIYHKDRLKLEIPIAEQIDDYVNNPDNPFLARATNVIRSAVKNNNVEALQKLEGLVGPDLMQPVKQSVTQRLLRGKSIEGFDIIGGTPQNPDSNPLRQRLAGIDDRSLKYFLGEDGAVITKNLAAIAPYLESAYKAKFPNKFSFGKFAGMAVPISVVASTIGVKMGLGPAAATVAGIYGLNRLLGKWYNHPAVTQMLIREGRPIRTPAMGRFMANRIIQTIQKLEEQEQGIDSTKNQSLSE